MTVEFDRSFERSLLKLNDRSLKEKLFQVIIKLEQAKDLASVRNIKKLSGYKGFYRIRIGDYRLGIESRSTDTVRLIVFAHRKDIYSVFPK